MPCRCGAVEQRKVTHPMQTEHPCGKFIKACWGRDGGRGRYIQPHEEEEGKEEKKKEGEVLTECFYVK